MREKAKPLGKGGHHSSTDSESIDLIKKANLSPPSRILTRGMGMNQKASVERGASPKGEGQVEEVPIVAMSTSSDEAWMEIEISKKTAVSTLNGVLKSSSSASSEDSGKQAG